MKKTEKAFKWIVDIFKKHDIPFILTGGFSAKIYGSPRELRDIDFDIPDDRLVEIIPDVRKFIIFGPKLYIDDVFNLTLLRLNYNEQEIDIGGGTYAKIFDRKNGTWTEDTTDFSSYESREIFGITIPVIKPQDLTEYKSKSPRNDDLIDIRAVQDYILSKHG